METTLAETEALLEETVDEEGLADTVASVVADCRTVVYEDARFCILDSEISDGHWQRCSPGTALPWRAPEWHSLLRSMLQSHRTLHCTAHRLDCISNARWPPMLARTC